MRRCLSRISGWSRTGKISEVGNGDWGDCDCTDDADAWMEVADEVLPVSNSARMARVGFLCLRDARAIWVFAEDL
ncbi:MAG: hypothetical protein A3H76_04735 [Candidatus Lloydbacteria bacterium RIFCSPLOWO2_02_FULL_54_12]|nr:MAG: hypothetical protein A3H76_04735 [Candidatus Lloydbacteria bacterium RIFCSPLOWO2_02_FULL_54_12]